MSNREQAPTDAFWSAETITVDGVAMRRIHGGIIIDDAWTDGNGLEIARVNGDTYESFAARVREGRGDVRRLREVA